MLMCVKQRIIRAILKKKIHPEKVILKYFNHLPKTTNFEKKSAFGENGPNFPPYIAHFDKLYLQKLLMNFHQIFFTVFTDIVLGICTYLKVF